MKWGVTLNRLFLGIMSKGESAYSQPPLRIRILGAKVRQIYKKMHPLTFDPGITFAGLCETSLLAFNHTRVTSGQASLVQDSCNFWLMCHETLGDAMSGCACLTSGTPAAHECEYIVCSEESTKFQRAEDAFAVRDGAEVGREGEIVDEDGGRRYRWR